jgi:hypothetical protein
MTSTPIGEEEEETGVTPNMPQLSRFKCVENTNYAVDLAKANGMHLVGIQGADIVDGKKTLVLGLVWQLMRCDYSSISEAYSNPFPIQTQYRKDLIIFVGQQQAYF